VIAMAHLNGCTDGVVDSDLVIWKNIREFCGSVLNDYSPDKIKAAFKSCVDEGLIEKLDDGYRANGFIEFNKLIAEKSNIFNAKKVVSKPQYEPSDESKKIVEYFIKYLTVHKPDRKPTSESTKISWCRDVDRMLLRDKRTPRRICEVIKWIFTSSDFWPPNIQSTKKLRDKFDQLEMQIRRDNGGTTATIPDGMVLEKGETVHDALSRYERKGLVPPAKLARWKQEIADAG